jgi:hypothetical protein
MATNQVCDVCGDPAKQPVHVVQLSVVIVGAVEPDQPTGLVHEVEACEGCWSKAINDMMQNVWEQLQQDVPAHRAVAVKNSEIIDSMRSLKAAVVTRDSIKATNSPEFAAANNEAIRLQGVVFQLEQDRAALLTPAG